MAKPSWKNQSLISALNGLQWLEDSRAVELALESLVNNEASHWTLATPIWDHRLAASNTLNALGVGDAGFQLIHSQLMTAMEEDNMNDALYNAQQLVNLSDARALESFDVLKAFYADRPNVLEVIGKLEEQLLLRLE